MKLLDRGSIHHNDIPGINSGIRRLSAPNGCKVEGGGLPLSPDRPKDSNAPGISVLSRSPRQRHGLDQGHWTGDGIGSRLGNRAIDGHRAGGR